LEEFAASQADTPRERALVAALIRAGQQRRADHVTARLALLLAAAVGTVPVLGETVGTVLVMALLGVIAGPHGVRWIGVFLDRFRGKGSA